MSRRKCCCPCETTCLPVRDAGKGDQDNLILEIPEALEDKDYCSGPTRNCEDQITGDHDLGFTAISGQIWSEDLTIEPNCHCEEGDFAEGTFEIIQECVDIAEEGDPEKLVCLVTVNFQVLENNACSYTVPEGASHRWSYKVLGPINVKDGRKFEVPFFEEEVGFDFAGSFCKENTYPDSVFIKEKP